MDAAVIVSSLRDKMKALLENKEVTPARLERNKIKRYLKDLHDGHELLTKQSDNKITLTDGLYSKLLRRAYEVEDIIDSFVLRAELQRQRMLTKMRSFIPLVSTCRQKSLSDELKEPMDYLKNLILKYKDTGKSHGTAESSASEEHQESVNKESTSHGQDADSAGPSISDEHKISSTTGQSNSNEKITVPAGSRVSDEQPANKFPTPIGRGPTNSNEHVRSDDQRVHERQPAHAVDSNNLEAKENAPDEQSTQTPGPSTVSGKKQAQTVAPQQWANISDRLDEELEFVGLDDQVKELIEATLKRQKLRFLISVVGAAGSGKTTIVRTIYNKAEIVESFQYRAWVHVSKEFSEKDLLIDILKQVTTIKDEEKLPPEKLQERVRDVLISSRCLIVLDDVRTSDVQNLLKNTFINSLNGSRVILTVRDRKIIDAIAAEGKYSLKMRKLTSPESLELFSKRVRTNNRSEIPKMETDNRRKMSGSASCNSCAGRFTVYQRTKQLDLPPHLKPCLLYLGLFPKELCDPYTEVVPVMGSRRIGEVLKSRKP
ncbi:DISEASE RESISTANCE PROTEIN RP [Salix viminalis]|uniref:DISEASE RESISTANCE PROTEIN RP n=1 Tax=Salix viminalis TaxID=40686 RepID=A0A9Q0UHK3_SALVM|nr:DISEASE RESISTANCE PROTEIN RP [Salix viminalis]